jgi:hypothetical protein
LIDRIHAARGEGVQRAQTRTFPPSLLLLRRSGGSDLRPWRQRLPTGPGGCTRTA